ncbi:hypothetical protein BDW62DRAFT_218628 [Aspergillus aurantiobrunneus]
MDLLKQRLTIGCMWAFEKIGVQELEDELLQEIPQADCHCEYSSSEEVLVIKGKLEGFTPTIAAMISSFIEKQKTKDLLDTPRLRLLDIPSVVRDNSSVTQEIEIVENSSLLTLDDDSAMFIPHPLTQVTKFWLSSAGGVGCFSSNKYRGMLGEIAKGTGTEIIVVDDSKGLQISGGSESDVDDALTKLARIEKPLSHLLNPAIGNIAVGPSEQDTGYRVQPYASLNPVALRRILADLSSGVNAGLGQMFVTTFYSFNEDSQKYTPPKNLVDPPLCNSENGRSRIWSDFSFQEVGKGEEFFALESIMENNNTESQLLPSGATAIHPFLSPEKEKQVNQWVVDGSNMEVPDTAQPEDHSCPTPRVESILKKPWVTDGKKAPGIKVRRPVQAAQVVASQNKKSSSPEVASSGPQVESNGALNTPRKRWKMKYEPNLCNSPEAQSSGAKVEKATSNRKVVDEFAVGNTQRLESTSHFPIKFDSTNYGLNKSSPRILNPISGSIQGEKAGRGTQRMKNKPVNKQNELIDVLTPINATKSNYPQLTFNTPALVPEPSTSGNGAQTRAGPSGQRSTTTVDTSFIDLAGLNIGEAANLDGSTTSGSLQDDSSSRENLSSQVARLHNLNIAYSSHLASAGSKTFVKPRQRPGEFSRLLEKRIIDDLERAQKSEMEQSVHETKSRQYHRTMNQRAGKPGQKTRSKAALLAKKQATLEDAWSMPKQKKPLETPQRQKISAESEAPPVTETEVRGQKAKPQNRQEAAIDEDTRRLFAAIKPTLEAAEAFPGFVTFEIQFGLVFIPLLPKTCNDNVVMSPNEWSKIFQPRTGMTAPTTKFINRLTVCGSEVDHIVDLRTSKAEGKTRIFEQEYSDYNITYEFHCRTKADEPLIIAIDEQGGYTIQSPKSVLGAVNMHFPQKIWDTRAVIGSAAQYQPDSHPELGEVAKYLADHLWIPAEKNIRIHTSLPKGTKMAIEKVFMKRWTRHRYIRPDEALGRDSQASESQNIFLQVMEVQDLFIGIITQGSSDNQHIRARCTKTEEMIQRGKIWYELSLVSPAIETILKTNVNLEVGERTEDWRSTDLLGNIAAFFTGQPPNSPGSPVAAAIGAGGIAELLHVAKAVVDKMDGVGACNRGPMGPDTLRTAANSAQGNKGWEFEELESVKEVESVVARVNQGEQAEINFW